MNTSSTGQGQILPNPDFFHCGWRFTSHIFHYMWAQGETQTNKQSIQLDVQYGLLSDVGTIEMNEFTPKAQVLQQTNRLTNVGRLQNISFKDILSSYEIKASMLSSSSSQLVFIKKFEISSLAGVFDFRVRFLTINIVKLFWPN